MPATIQGPGEAAAAIFIYKTDAHQRIAWEDSADADRTDRQRHAYAKQQGPLIRRELCKTKDQLLAALLAWNLADRSTKNLVENTKASDETPNLFLLIYAHGVQGHDGLTIGLAPGDVRSEIVTWADLKSALPCGVDALWLIGCQTATVERFWTPPSIGPVRRRIIVTNTTRDWKLMIPAFAEEISLNPVMDHEELRLLIKHISGAEAEILYVHDDTWVRARG